MPATKTPVYRRILVKYSGEALMGQSSFGIDPKVLRHIAEEVKECIASGVETALVIGGGNLFRGKALSEAGLGRVTGDHMGMLATVMNALALRDTLEQLGVPTRIMSSISMMGVVDPYNYRKAMVDLSEKHAVIFAAGTGNPFFTTDTAACLRAIEIEADVVLKATKVDGVYNLDPVKHPEAVRYERLSYEDVLHQNLKVMDLTAICLCQEQNLPLRVFNMQLPGALKKIIAGEAIGTLVGATS